MLKQPDLGFHLAAAIVFGEGVGKDLMPVPVGRPIPAQTYLAGEILAQLRGAKK